MIYLSNKDVIKIHANGINKSSKNSAPIKARIVMINTLVFEGAQ